jgi:hypothetical protein
LKIDIYTLTLPGVIPLIFSREYEDEVSARVAPAVEPKVALSPEAEVVLKPCLMI